MKTPIIISIGLIAILIALVLGWAVFVKTEPTTLVQPPVAKNGENANMTPAPSVEPTPTPDDASAPTPSPSSEIDTSDWLSYRNEEFGFELKYPKGWNVKENIQENNTMFLNTNKEVVLGGIAPDDYWDNNNKINPKYTNNWMGLKIDIYSKPANFNWDSWLKDKNFPIEKYENYNYKDLKGIKITELNGIFYGKQNIFLENEKLYNVRLFNEYPYNTTPDYERENLGTNIYNQILSSFKFIK